MDSRIRAICKVPEIVWYPLTATITILATGFLGLAGHQLWLFPSLAPTAYILAIHPHHQAARPYNAIAGHLLAMGMGFLAVRVLGASASAPAAMSSHRLTAVRVWASGLAIFWTLLLQYPLKALHPPSASTALLVTLGAFNPTWSDARVITFGVLITTSLGQCFRWLELAQESRCEVRDKN